MASGFRALEEDETIGSKELAERTGMEMPVLFFCLHSSASRCCPIQWQQNEGSSMRGRLVGHFSLPLFSVLRCFQWNQHADDRRWATRGSLTPTGGENHLCLPRIFANRAPVQRLKSRQFRIVASCPPRCLPAFSARLPSPAVCALVAEPTPCANSGCVCGSSRN